MKVVKYYKLTLYYDGYMSDKKAERNLKGLKYFDTKPTEADIEDFIKERISILHVNKLRDLNIEVKKEYKIVLE